MNTYQLLHIRSGSTYEVDAIDLCELHKKAKSIFTDYEDDDFCINTIIKIPEPLYPIRRKRKRRYRKNPQVETRGKKYIMKTELPNI